jgi:brefeldin A-resistance guanine nucleotide exchange factor 1
LVKSGIVAEPITPRSVASFLRNGIVVGLNKKEVGAYLGEVGKSPQAGKSPPNWERDWFHKEVFATYYSLFRFVRQSLLDGLRMFLASFRLPGEAQQIDRILQAFSDSCGQCCDESATGSSKIFSDDPKRASDAAYLLSFSIITLNTDQHNDNIREDRKMSKADFIKNNSDYGCDITEPGKELPPVFLGTIYDSIREEEIRTEGEGADGSMTVERWKDVLRGSSEDDSADTTPTELDAEDLTELVVLF